MAMQQLSEYRQTRSLTPKRDHPSTRKRSLSPARPSLSPIKQKPSPKKEVDKDDVEMSEASTELNEVLDNKDDKEENI